METIYHIIVASVGLFLITSSFSLKGNKTGSKKVLIFYYVTFKAMAFFMFIFSIYKLFL